MGNFKCVAFWAIAAVLSTSECVLASCGGQNPPVVTSITPSFGSVSGGTVVTISGTSLGCVTVSFGNIPAISVTATATSVTATSPAGNVGTAVVTVTNPPFGGGTTGPFAGASTTTQFNYITTADAPTNLVALTGNAEVSVSFDAPTNTGGSEITDYEYMLDGGSWVSAGTTTSPVMIRGLSNGTSYTVALRAVNAAGAGAASAAVSLNMPSPASEFAAKEDTIRDIVQDEAARSLDAAITTNERMTRDARERFIAKQDDAPSNAEDGDVPLDVSGGLDASGATISSKGILFGSQRLGNGGQRLVFGDFDVQRNSDTGSSTATLTGRIAWEQGVSDTVTVGYCVGGELAYSSIEGAFAGNQNRVGVTAGGYAVQQLAESTYLDGFMTFGAGRNNLEMADDVLTLESDYLTKSVTFGGALSGVMKQSGYEIRPELSFSFGRTWINDVGFTGSAYGLVDDALSLDAGSVTMANIMFRPEFLVPLDGLSGAESLQRFTFAPRLICERIKTDVKEEDCGGGAEVGVSGRSLDGLSTYSAMIAADRVGDRSSSTLLINLERKF